MQSIFNDPKTADLDIVVDGNIYHAHRAVVCAASGLLDRYIREVRYGPPQGLRARIIDLDSICADCRLVLASAYDLQTSFRKAWWKNRITQSAQVNSENPNNLASWLIDVQISRKINNKQSDAYMRSSFVAISPPGTCVKPWDFYMGTP